jgi:all-trans-retinol 13,14-reductase
MTIAGRGAGTRSRRAAERDASLWPMPPRLRRPVERDCHDVIVVGAGIGGLTAAALLAQRGRKVLVVESHNRPGGFCSCWDRTNAAGQSFRFDAGVQDFSGLGVRGPLRHLLRALNAEARIEWRRVRHLYHRDGFTYHVPQDAPAIVASLAASFSAEHAAVASFLAEMEAVYRELYADIDATGGVPMAPSSFAAMLTWPARHPHAWRWMQQPFAAMLKHFVIEPILQAVLTTLSEYLTDQPETLRVIDMAPLFGYYFDGGYYPLGGSQRLADLLSDIIVEHGGQVLLSTRIKRILIEDGRVAGAASASGRVARAPIVIGNGDVVAMLTDLVGEPHVGGQYLAQLRAMRRGPSAILLSLGLDMVPDLPARVFVQHDALAFGIGNPSVIDPTLAPPGCAALTMLCLLPEAAAAAWRRREPGYGQSKDCFADRLIDATEATVIPGLRRYIVHCEVAGPPSFTRFARTRNGNVYGAARDQWQPQVKSPVPGLLLVGAGTATGPGVEAVVVSGTMAANLITDE